MKNKDFSPEKKDRRKKIRAVLQGIILICIVVVIFKALFSFNSYAAYNDGSQNNTQDTGFIALSYFGVDRRGDEKLISVDNLEGQLKSLKDNGYVTITQQDILDFYEKGKTLPKKALFLLFED